MMDELNSINDFSGTNEKFLQKFGGKEVSTIVQGAKVDPNLIAQLKKNKSNTNTTISNAGVLGREIARNMRTFDSPTYRS